VVSSPEIADPIAVRFGFSNTAESNLFNGAGLPASLFRTDDWFINTQLPGIGAEALKKAGRYVVTISTKDPSAVIRYTTDGSDPDYNSKKYTKPFKLKGSITIKARTFINGTASENIAEFKIPIKE